MTGIRLEHRRWSGNAVGVPRHQQAVEIASGVFWLRLAQPLALDHVNCYLLEDYGGWTLIDTGVGGARAHEQWDALLGGVLNGMSIRRILTTHAHPDHIGASGWLSRRFNAPVYSNAAELERLRLMLRPFDPPEVERGSRFYRLHGMDPAAASFLALQDSRYAGFVDELPEELLELDASNGLDIGGRKVAVTSGAGHSPHALLFHLAEEAICISGDQLLGGITPLVGVWTENAREDPLADYLTFLARMADNVDPATLILGGHQQPFVDAPSRAAEIRRHHDERCGLIVRLCADGGKTASDLVPLLFPQATGGASLGFAFGEVLAHLVYLVGRGELFADDRGGITVHVALTPDSARR